MAALGARGRVVIEIEKCSAGAGWAWWGFGECGGGIVGFGAGFEKSAYWG